MIILPSIPKNIGAKYHAAVGLSDTLIHQSTDLSSHVFQFNTVLHEKLLVLIFCEFLYYIVIISIKF